VRINVGNLPAPFTPSGSKQSAMSDPIN